jgi:hypothetical protein
MALGSFRGEHDQRRANGRIDPERPLPAQPLGTQAANDRARSHAGADNRAPEGEGSRTRRALEGVREGGEPSHINPDLLHRLGWNDVGEKNGLATNAALTLDPTSVTDAGQFLGFTVLPLMVAAPAENFFSRSADTTDARRLPDRTIAEIIARAWE